MHVFENHGNNRHFALFPSQISNVFKLLLQGGYIDVQTATFYLISLLSSYVGI